MKQQTAGLIIMGGTMKDYAEQNFLNQQKVKSKWNLKSFFRKLFQKPLAVEISTHPKHAIISLLIESQTKLYQVITLQRLLDSLITELLIINDFRNNNRLNIITKH